MSRLIEKFLIVAEEKPDQNVFRNSRGESITFGEMEKQSRRLANHLLTNAKKDAPIVIYGHKSPAMLVGIVACMRSGHPYVPLDIAYPEVRIESIIEQLDDPYVISMEEGQERLPLCNVSVEQLEFILADISLDSEIPLSVSVSGKDPVYILFTSGSTGKPKGVSMGAAAIDAFSDYYAKFRPSVEGAVLFNRVPFTFDVSVFDMVIALPFGYELFALEREAEASLGETLSALAGCDMALWVSTPSFVEMCLADSSFNAGLLRNLESMVLCGETLTRSTASRILDAFPSLKLYNTYGPTETQAVTDIQITREILHVYDNLPIGYPGNGTQIIIVDGEGRPVGSKQNGEIFIAGPTLSNGYYNRSDLTERAFVEVETDRGKIKGYKTGDVGFAGEDGLMFFLGRRDAQVKINGYRVELGEIEGQLMELSEVDNACVVTERKKGDVSDSLIAFVVLSQGRKGGIDETRRLKTALKASLPAYMIPRKIKYIEEIPLNTNGKADRKILQEMI